MSGCDEWADVGCFVPRIADGDLLHGVGDGIDCVLVDVRVRVDAGVGGAVLTGVVGGTEGERVGHRLDVRVWEDVSLGLAAEFEVQALDAASRRGHHCLAFAAGAGEGDHRGIRIGDQRVAELVATRHHVQQSGWKSDFCCKFGQADG